MEIIRDSALINKEIIIIDLDWVDDTAPSTVEGVIIKKLDDDKYLINLKNQFKLYDGSLHHSLIIEGRHTGYPVIKILPSLFRRLFIFKHPLSRLFTPLVSVNISTEDGTFFSRGCLYLKSVYVRATGK